MKIIITAVAFIVIMGCSKEPEYTNGKTLYDKDGCAFIAIKNVGDTIFLRYNFDLSKGTCKYKENK